MDPWDPALYDLVICIDKIAVEGAVDQICLAASHEAFRQTEGARRKLEDLALACKVKSMLLDLDHNIVVTSEYGNVIVHTRAEERKG